MDIVVEVIEAEQQALKDVENKRLFFEKKLISEKELLLNESEEKILSANQALEKEISKLDSNLESEFSKKKAAQDKKLSKYDKISAVKIRSVAKTILKGIESKQKN